MSLLKVLKILNPLSVAESVDETGVKTSRFTPTQMMKYQFGAFIKIGIYVLITFVFAVSVMWRESVAERNKHYEILEGFNKTLIDATITQKDVLRTVEKLDATLTSLDGSIQSMEHRLIDMDTIEEIINPKEVYADINEATIKIIRPKKIEESKE